MSVRKVSLVPNEFYHIYNRGNSKQVIFKDRNDYVRFQQMLYVMNSVEGVVFRFIEEKNMYTYDRGNHLVHIGAYCLMPNHFHILLTPAVEGGVQMFMQKLSTGYSMYFNKKHERTGGLFEGRYKASIADSDVHLKYLYTYIHLNPIKLIQSDWKETGVANIAETRKYLRAYAFSSYMEYIGETRKEKLILDTTPFPKYFMSKDDFEKNIFDWFDENKQVGPV